MILLSRIVKSIAVVDDRPGRKKSYAEKIEANLNEMPVLKKQIFSYRENPYADETLVLPDKQGYLDELNRIKVEIAQAKAELRNLGRDIDEAIEQNNNVPGDEPEDEYSRALAAKAEAERLLRETKKNTADMMADAQAEAERLAEQARNDGYLEGFEKGFAQATDEFKTANDPKIKELDSLLEEISNYREEMIARNEQDLLDTVMAVAEKIIGREIKNDPRAIVTMLYKVLDENRREESVRITVSPDLMPVEAKASAEVKKIITSTAPNALIYIEDDEGDGVCVVETDKGITDLSVKTQLQNAKKLLTE